MLPETMDLYSKYRYFLYLLGDERLMLFKQSENAVDFDSFFEYYNWIIHMHWKLKPMYKSFNSRRSQAIKKFNYGKYYILLRPYFCRDISCHIIEFIQ